jgi:Lecithin retinol acyltransferase
MYGDEHVVRPEFLGLVPYRHHGIELPDGRMAENSPPGVRVTGYGDFTRGRATRVISRPMTGAERDQAVQRALFRVGERRYSLTGWNCEHFASWCATGITASQQVVAWLAALARAMLVTAAALLAATTVKAALDG